MCIAYKSPYINTGWKAYLEFIAFYQVWIKNSGGILRKSIAWEMFYETPLLQMVLIWWQEYVLFKITYIVSFFFLQRLC